MIRFYFGLTFFFLFLASIGGGCTYHNPRLPSGKIPAFQLGYQLVWPPSSPASLREQWWKIESTLVRTPVFNRANRWWLHCLGPPQKIISLESPIIHWHVRVQQVGNKGVQKGSWFCWQRVYSELLDSPGSNFGFYKITWPKSWKENILISWRVE